ncbi:MAG: glycosyltransferase family 2 protein [Flavobacteriales bacterium]|jgi:glycosyltransferase involved in cell wall biosynthesis
MAAQQTIELSIVVPIFNEEENLPELHRRLSEAARLVTTSYELVFVNDGSRDASASLLQLLAQRDERVYYINFSRNFGHQIAVTAGLDRCSGRAVVIIDGDLQDPPEVIPQLHALYKTGIDVVYARRSERKGETWFKRTTAKLFYRVLRRSTSIDIPLDTGDFRLIDRKVVNALKQMPEQSKFLRGQIAWLGFKQGEVLFSRDKRLHGKTGYPLSKMLRFAMDGITSFSDRPLKLVTAMGFAISFLSVVIILYAMYSHFVLLRTITGWTSLIISSTFIGGVQLLSIGIIGEYISRMNKNILNRPLYVVESSNLPSDKR